MRKPSFRHMFCHSGIYVVFQEKRGVFCKINFANVPAHTCGGNRRFKHVSFVRIKSAKARSAAAYAENFQRMRYGMRTCSACAGQTTSQGRQYQHIFFILAKGYFYAKPLEGSIAGVELKYEGCADKRKPLPPIKDGRDE